MNKEQKLERIRKNGKILSVIARVVEIIAIVGAALSAAGAIAMAFFGQDKAGMFVDLGHPEQAEPWQTWLLNNFEEKTAFVMMCVVLILVCAALAVIMYLVRRACLTLMESDTPFRPEVIKYMKIIAVLLAVAALFEGVGPAIITGLAGWTVVLIFEYGCALQDESDEIL